MFDYRDSLEILNKNIPLSSKFIYLHKVLQKKYAFVERISASLCDNDTNSVKTFLHNSGNDEPLVHYSTNLDDAPSLLEIKTIGLPRVVNDLSIFNTGSHAHTKRIMKKGYAASYTLPMYMNNKFFGFIFFNSNREFNL